MQTEKTRNISIVTYLANYIQYIQIQVASGAFDYFNLSSMAYVRRNRYLMNRRVELPKNRW